MKPKLNICLIFGGKSGEHEVSLQSAQSVIESLDKDKYNLVLVGIDKKGRWLLGPTTNYLLNSNNPKLIALNTSKTKEITPISAQALKSIDVFIPLIHGTYGEDGSLQGFLELMDSAYIGAGVLGSAIGMDKDIMKRLLKAAGLPVTPFISLKNYEITDKNITVIGQKLGFPLFVKPANLGSSVGVIKVHKENDLSDAIQKALQYDTKIIAEQMVQGREVEVAVLGNDHPIASIPGEIIPHHEFYSYEAKYIDENGASLKIPANLTTEQVKHVQELALKAFKILESSGMARVDFFLKPDGTFIINEINTIPGFTKISMYPKLWEVSGISYPQLLDRLIDLAIEKKKQKNSLKRSYSA